MKKLLILSYHALPMDVVSSYRAKAFCDHLHSFGIYPTLLTHRWELNDEKKWKFHVNSDNEIIERNEFFTVIRLPRLKSTNPKRNVLNTILNYFTGDLEADLEQSYVTFRKFLLVHLKENKYDAILTIYSPHFQMKISNEMKQKFGIPYITDFRDLWDNEVITKAYRPTLRKKVVDFAIRFWWKKWIQDAIFFSVTGEQWREYLQKLSGVQGLVVRNGYEGEMEGIISEPISKDEFVIAHFGKLYPNQDLLTFLHGFQLFVKNHPNSKIKLIIIGHKPRLGVNIDDILSILPADTWKVYPYLKREELFNYCKAKVSVFWMPGFINDNGQFPVKVYDYLLLGINILFVPKNDSDVEQTIRAANAGAICKTSREVEDQLTTWYESFIANRHLLYSGNEVEIQKHRRVNQVKILAERVHEYLN